MLTITVPGEEFFDEKSNEFVTIGDVTLELEHSLVSLSKWESIWEKPFLGKGEKTAEETLSYIKCMTLTPNVPPEVYEKLSKENIEAINEYVSKKHSATWFREVKGQGNTTGELVTAEVIYYWLVAMNIPFEVQTWHLNKLFTLVKVIGQKNAPKKRMGRREAAAQQRALNAQRLSQFGTNG